ncbi:MAG: MarR family transcriptional regulator [Pseudomonadota bacterium]
MKLAHSNVADRVDIRDHAATLPAPFGLGDYVETLMLIERLHRELIDTVKCALEAAGRTDPTAVQALMLYHLAEREMTASELGSRGLYQGSNVSYNLKKLVDGGFVEYRRCTTDGRAVRLSLSRSGLEVQEILEDLFRGHATAFGSLAGETGMAPDHLPAALRLIRQSRMASAAHALG